MPVLANLIGLLAGFFWNVFARFLSYKTALKVSAYLAWTTVFIVFVTAVLTCMSMLSSGVSAAFSALGSPSPQNWPGYFAMGLGMVIPPNAPGIFGCLASIWVATQVVRIKRAGIENFAK